MIFTIPLKAPGIKTRACQLHYRPAAQRMAYRGNAPGIHIAGNTGVVDKPIHHAAQIARALPELPGILLRFIAAGCSRVIRCRDNISLRRHALRQPVEVAPVATIPVREK